MEHSIGPTTTELMLLSIDHMIWTVNTEREQNKYL